MKWIMKKHIDRWHTVLLCIYMLLWVAYLWLRKDIYTYQYLTVVDIPSFMLLSIIIPLVPLVVWILAVISLNKGSDTRATVLLGIYIPIIIAVNFLSAAELLYLPTTCSYTTDPNAWETINNRWTITSNVVDFPCTIPEDAENLQLCYCYQSASGETVYIAVVWEESDEQEYEELLRQYVGEPFSGTQYHSGWRRTGYSFFYNAVLVDKETNQIGFVLSNRNELLPNHINDMIRTPASILTI